jgi:hypothetical protein
MLEIGQGVPFDLLLAFDHITVVMNGFPNLWLFI